MTRSLAARGRRVVDVLRRLPWGFLGSLVLVILIERSLIAHNLAFSNLSGECWNRAGREVLTVAPGKDVLCMGDSQIKCGMVTPLIEERTGRSAYNLAAFGAPPPATYFLLRRALASGAAPRTIVLGFSPDLLGIRPGEMGHFQWADLLDLRETVELAWTSRDPELFASITLSRLFPSIKNRKEIRVYVFKALCAESWNPVEVALQFARNWNQNRGTVIFNKVDYPINDPIEAKRLEAAQWRPDPTNAAYLRRCLKLAEAKNIQVVWVISPSSPVTQQFKDNMGITRKYERFVYGVLERHPHVLVLDGRRSGYTKGVFYDPGHVDRDGAIGLTNAVVEYLRGDLITRRDAPTPERWVALPKYQAPSLRIPIEDIGESWGLICRLRKAQMRR